MRVGILGGGISGLSSAYYLNKFNIPVSEILLYEASSKFGGWIESKQIEHNGDKFIFEKGPRTLRLATGELKEMNSLQLAADLKLNQNVDLISKTHPASLYRYIYFNNKICPVSQSLFKKQELLPKRLISYLYKELNTPKRSDDIQDESVWDFIARRFDPAIADNLVDPLFKGICGGDIKQLSAATLVRTFYDFEKEYGSIIKGAISKKKDTSDKKVFQDLVDIRPNFKNQSVWRIDCGMQELVKKIVENLSEKKNLQLNLNEPVSKLEFLSNINKIELTTNKRKENVDIVISSIYSKYLADLLPNEYIKLKNLLGKIESVDMAVINFYFKSNILPVKGFGYLVPTNQKSPIIGCIFDSVFNKPEQKNTVLTVMMGGHWYNEYIGNKNNEQIYELALNELKKHLNFKINPDLYEVTILKNCIPQYRVGHQQLLNEINDCLVEYKLNDKLYLVGNTYDGIGVNDSIFGSRKLIQNVISNHSLIQNKV